MSSGIWRGLAVLLVIAPVAVFAQEKPDADDEDIEEVIVTAQKRATNLQDVPFSVAALTASDIEEAGATNIVELARNVPGLYITDLGPGQSQVAIRGISAGQVVRDQAGVKESVGIYLDESPVSIALFTPDLDLYDLDRIEVLRGPQGTLFGAGSSSGTVRYITAQPNIGEFSGSADLTLNDVNEGDFGGSLRGSINVPLGESAAMRAVGYYSELPGFIDSYYPGRDVRKDVNSGTRTGGRLAFRFEPSETFTITPRIVYQKLETDGYPRADVYNITGSVTKDLGGTDAQARLNSPLYDTTDLQVLSQEIRFASLGEGAFQWVAGVFYQQYDREYGQNLPTPGYDALSVSLGLPPSSAFNAPPDTPFFSDLNYDFEQFGVFGEATYRFNSKWALTGGLRYYDFTEDRTLTFAGLFADVGYTDQPGSTSSDGFSPRAILAYSPNGDVQFTAQVAKGFRLGGINDPLNVTLCSAADLVTYSGHENWEDETVLNYELGTKTRWADDRITFNAAIFMSEIEGLQVIADAGSCSSRIILNAESTSKGAEFEFYVRPDTHWDFGLSATFVQAEITESQLASGQPIAGIRDGNRLPTAPELQAVANLAYNWSMTPSIESYVRFTFQHVGSSYTQLADQEPNFGLISNSATRPAGSARLINLGGVDSDPNAPGAQAVAVAFDARLPAYEIGNLRWGVRTDSWEAALFVNNLWDEQAYTSIDRERGRSARVGYLTNPPRTIGVNFHMNF